jgi:homoserine dehydrogenase
MPDFKIGLLGHGTVGAAFATLIERRAGEIEATTGLRPRVTGVLTRSRGDFAQILDGSDLVWVILLSRGREPSQPAFSLLRRTFPRPGHVGPGQCRGAVL